MVYPIILLFLLGVFKYLNQKSDLKERDAKHKIYLFFLSILLIIIATFRDSEMRDYLNYYEFFLKGSADWKEPSFTLFTSFTSSYNINPIWGFFIFALLSISIKMYDIVKLSPSFWGSFIVWLGSTFILHDMIQIRAAVASGILIWSIKYIYYRRFYHFIICILLASAFHYSSLVFCLFYFLKPYKIQKKLYLIIIPIAYICASWGITFGGLVSSINLPSIQTLYKFYCLENDSLNIFNPFQILRIITAVILVYRNNIIMKFYPYSTIVIKIYVIGIISLLLLSDISTLAIRVSELILCVEILTVPLIVYIFPKFQLIFGKLYVILYSAFFLLMEIFYLNYLSLFK